MIVLDVAEYCHNCDAFDPVAINVRSPEAIYTAVRCNSAKKCFNIQRYLTKEFEKNHGGKDE